MDDDFDFGEHERLRRRVANKMDGLLWTYKQHYKAGEIFSLIDRGADIFSTVLAGVLTYGLVWKSLPNAWMIGLAIAIAVVSGIKSAARPQKRSEEHFRAGDAYHRQFDKFRDFTVLDLANPEYGLESMRKDFEDLTIERRKLNDSQMGISSVWYYWLRLSYWLRQESPYDEIGTTDEALENLASEADFSDLNDFSEMDEVAIQELTGVADVSRSVSGETNKE